MKRSEFVRFLKNGLFFILIASLVLNLVGFQQQTLAATNIKVIRRTDEWPPHMDPAVGSDTVSAIALCNVYDSLIFPNLDGSIKPLLAKTWKVSGSGLVYTFELRQGVKFHNGDTLTAADVVFSLQRFLSIGEGYAYLFIGVVKNVKAVGNYTVQITLNKPFGPFLGTLARFYILDKKQLMTHLRTGTHGAFKDYGMGWLVTHDAGSGPYTLKEINMEESLTLEKFNGYWGGWANKDAPQYVQDIGNNQAVTVRTLISKGELEITDQWQTNENLTAISKLPNTKLTTFSTGTVLNIMLNTKKSPTDDIHFRKALAYCVDYQQIMAKIFPGGIPSTAVAPSVPGYNPNLKPYTLNLAKAQAELKQSRYYGKLGQYPVALYWVAEVPDEEKVALMVQANALSLGIKVNVVKVPWVSLVADVATVKTTPTATIIMTGPSYDEAGAVLSSRYSSSSCGTWEQCEWLQNPTIDKLIADALATGDQKARFQKYYAVQAKIYDLCPTIWVLQYPIRQAYRSDYVVFPIAVAISQGKTCSPIDGYDFYYRDFKVFPEKAQQPYVPFKP